MALVPKELQEIATTEKPWGRFIQYALNQPVTVKILEIRAGEQVSYQYHHHRSELWIPLDEGACVKLDGTLQRPKQMEPVFIPQGAKHQLIGESKDYRILEIAFGHFDEEDIVRLSDKYGRVEARGDFLDRNVYFSLGEPLPVTEDKQPIAQQVDIALQEIHALFQEEASAPLSALEDRLRAWTRSHLQHEDIDQVAGLATRAREEFSVLVTVGIGGSDLSARVFHDSFNSPYHNLLSPEERGGAPEVYFTGDTFDPRKLDGLLEMLTSRNLLHKTLFNVISKSGTTTETMATLMSIRGALDRVDWQQQVLATTGLTPDSVLCRMHEQSPFYGETLLPVPDGVGGRFSAFSPVGLFFLAATAGRAETPETRIRSALRGVGTANDDFNLSHGHQDNVAYQLARWIHLAEEMNGKDTLIFYNYADNACLGDWFVQLYTESIQERCGGANVIPAKGPTSNHSILNGIIAGPRDKVVLFIHYEDLGSDLVLPTNTDVDSKLTELEGMSMTHMQTASYRGTALDFREKGVATATLTLPSRDIQSVCQLMRILMDTIAVKGRLQNLHLDTKGGNELTYLQDGVEGYKQNFRSFALASGTETAK